jgi:hypothetical protein
LSRDQQRIPVATVSRVLQQLSRINPFPIIPNLIKDKYTNKFDVYMARYFKKMYFCYIMPKQSFSPVYGGLPGAANSYGFMIVVSFMIIIFGVERYSSKKVGLIKNSLVR